MTSGAAQQPSAGRTRRRAAVTAAAIASLLAAAPAAAADTPPTAPEQSRIINGRDAAGEAPSTVAIGVRVTATQTRLCGGTLVAPTVIVTATHCLVYEGQGVPAGNVFVAYGSLDLTSPDIQFAYPASVATHPAFTGIVGSPGDVAVITLAQPLTGIPTTPVAAPAEAAQLTAPGTPATIAGWGLTSFSDESAYPARMQTANVYIHPTACSGWQPYTVAGSTYSAWGTVVDPAGMICAAATTPTGGIIVPFAGDSGGPLLAGPAGQQRLVGVVSFGKTTPTSPPHAAVFVRLAAYNDWLTAHGVPATQPDPTPAPPAPAPTPTPTPEPTPAPPPPTTDRTAPVVTAYAAAGRRGTTIRLRYRVVEAAGRTQERIKVRNSAGRVVWTAATTLSTTKAGVTYYLPYKLPRNASSGTWCIRSFDPAGNISPWSCARLTARPGR